MTETPENPTAAGTPAPESAPKNGPGRLYAAAAWVVIVAGIVFIASTVFFTGMFLAKMGDGPRHHHGDRGGHSCPMMQHRGPGHGPGMMHGGPERPDRPERPAQPGAEQQQTPAPATPPGR